MNNYCYFQILMSVHWVLTYAPRSAITHKVPTLVVVMLDSLWQEMEALAMIRLLWCMHGPA